MIRRPPRSTQSRSSAASDVYKRQRYSLSQYLQGRRKPGETHDRIQYQVVLSALQQLLDAIRTTVELDAHLPESAFELTGRFRVAQCYAPGFEELGLLSQQPPVAVRRKSFNVDGIGKEHRDFDGLRTDGACRTEYGDAFQGFSST